MNIFKYASIKVSEIPMNIKADEKKASNVRPITQKIWIIADPLLFISSECTRLYLSNNFD